MSTSRRSWLAACLTLPALPELLAAREHARHAMSVADGHFTVLEPTMVPDVDALSSQIIPSTDGPGAHEAGVVYFIDRALDSFAADQRGEFLDGFQQTALRSRQMFSPSTSIHALTADQQQQLLTAIEKTPFFDLLRTLTVLGYLGDPSYGGNRDQVGWKQIGFDPQMSYQHPFGYYDGPDQERV